MYSILGVEVYVLQGGLISRIISSTCGEECFNEMKEDDVSDEPFLVDLLLHDGERPGRPEDHRVKRLEVKPWAERFPGPLSQLEDLDLPHLVGDSLPRHRDIAGHLASVIELVPAS